MHTASQTWELDVVAWASMLAESLTGSASTAFVARADTSGACAQIIFASPSCSAEDLTDLTRRLPCWFLFDPTVIGGTIVAWKGIPGDVMERWIRRPLPMPREEFPEDWATMLSP